MPQGIRRRRRPDEAAPRPNKLGGDLWVVKAQVHAGGRGKAGGVKLAKERRGGARACRAMLGTTARDAPVRPEGLPVNVVYVEEPAPTSIASCT